MNLLERAKVTQATLDSYRGRPSDHAGNEWPCIYLLHDHLTACGYDVPEIPELSDLRSVLKAMKERGWNSVPDMLDQHLERIAPAMMMMGDVAVSKSEAGVDAILICAGPMKLFGWREDLNTLVIIDDDKMDDLVGAWRV